MRAPSGHRSRIQDAQGQNQGTNLPARIEGNASTCGSHTVGAEQRSPTVQPRRSARIARQRRQPQGEDRSGQQSRSVHSASEAAMTRGRTRSNAPTSERLDALLRPGMGAGTPRQRVNERVECIVAFERQPPAEIQTGTMIPNLVVTLELRGESLNGREPPIQDSNLNAMAALMAADGETPMASFANEIVMRPMTATPTQRYPVAQDGMWWKFVFTPGEIFVSGYFRIRVIIMHTPMGDRGSGMEVGSPVQLISATSRLIHVHTFACRS